MIIITDPKTFASALQYLQYIRACYIPKELKPSFNVLVENGLIKIQSRYGVEYVYPTNKVFDLSEKELRKIIEDSLTE